MHAAISGWRRASPARRLPAAAVGWPLRLDDTGLRQTLAWSVYPEPHGDVVWLCTPDYLLRYDLVDATPPPADFTTLSPQGDGQRRQRSSTAARPSQRRSMRACPTRQRSLHFEFAAPRFEDARRNEFQSYLEGFDEPVVRMEHGRRRACTPICRRGVSLPRARPRRRRRVGVTRSSVHRAAALVSDRAGPTSATSCWCAASFVLSRTSSGGARTSSSSATSNTWSWRSCASWIE